MAQLVKNLPAMWETWVQSLVWKEPLEKRTGYPLHFPYLHTYRSKNIYNQHPKDPSCAPSLPWDRDHQAQVSHNLHAILPLWQLQTQESLNVRDLGHYLINIPPPCFEFRGEMTCSRSHRELQNLTLLFHRVTKSWPQLSDFHTL